MKPICRINIVTSLFWAVAIIAAAIVKAPTFFTIVLLPMLASASLGRELAKAITSVGDRYKTLDVAGFVVLEIDDRASLGLAAWVENSSLDDFLKRLRQHRGRIA